MNVAVSQSPYSPSSTPEATLRELFAKAGIEIGGGRSIDPRVLDSRFYSRVLAGGSLALGESYVDGWWEVDSLDDFIAQVIISGADSAIVPISTKVQILKSRILNMQDRLRCTRVVKDHYDLSNQLYAKMLDPWMQYTCAYYANASDLNQAQENKLEQICKKLQIKSGDQVLELGCGFGGLAKYMAEKRGCRVTGYNISKEQVAWARAWTKDLPVEIRQEDYRNAHGKYDKVVAVGLCEHVGYKNYRVLHEVAHRCLKPGGIFLLHTIGGNTARVTTDPWLEKYIFPGSVMPSASQLAKAFEGLFVMEDWHNFGEDYDRTLMDWNKNFERNWNEIKALGYDDRFYRLWRYYLLLCAGSFRARKNQNWELVLSKGGTPDGGRFSRC